MIDLGFATQTASLTTSTDTMAHNLQGFSSDQLTQQQQQQLNNNLGNNDLLGSQQYQNQGMNSFSNSSAGISPAMLLPNQPFAALLQPGGGNTGTGLADQSEGSGSHQPQNFSGMGFDVNSELKRLQQLQQQMNQGESQNALLMNPSNSMISNSNNNTGNANNSMSMMGGAGASMGDGGSSSTSQQQPQQELPGNAGGMMNTAPMMNSQGMASGMNNQNALLQQMIEQQKMQNQSFMGNAAGNAGFATGNNLFGTQSALLGDPRFFLAQSQLGGLPNLGGQDPLPAPHALFSRDGTRRMRGGVIVSTTTVVWTTGETKQESLNRFLTLSSFALLCFVGTIS